MKINCLIIFVLWLNHFVYSQQAAGISIPQLLSPAHTGANSKEELVLAINQHKIGPATTLNGYLAGLEKVLYVGTTDHFSGWVSTAYQDLNDQLKAVKLWTGGAYHRNLSGRFAEFKHQLGVGVHLQLGQWNQNNRKGWVSNQYDINNLAVDYNLPTGEALDLSRNFQTVSWQMDGGLYYQMVHRRGSLRIAPAIYGLNKPRFQNELTWWQQDRMYRLYVEGEVVLNQAAKFYLFGWYQQQTRVADMMAGWSILFGRKNDETTLRLTHSVTLGSAPTGQKQPMQTWFNIGTCFRALTLEAGYGFSLNKINNYGTPFQLTGKYQLNYLDSY